MRFTAGMHARVQRVVVLGLALLGTVLLAVSLADMRGLNGRLASAAAKPVPVEQVDQHDCHPYGPSKQRHHKAWQKT
jgi:hypothetical protein